MARDYGVRPSSLLEVENKTLAISFDRACSLRLRRYDNERELDKFRALAKMLGAGDSIDDGAQPKEIEGGAVNW